MENKYYTPTIDEFHVGLEYEFYTFDNEWVKCKMSYEPVEIKNSFILSKKGYESFPLFNEMKEYLQNRLDRIRVKYLDKTDIESLGFVDIHKGTDRSSIDRCYKYQLRKIVSNKYEPIPTYKILCDLHYYPDKPGIIYIGGLCDFKIKNKSELVKLLKMLGIC